MGLDTTHGCYHGNYGGFSAWRRALAVASGYGLITVEGHEYPKIEWGKYQRYNFQGNWKQTPADILIVLFVHSDCEGMIKWRHTKSLADRLKEIEPKLKDHGLQEYEAQTQRFISGLLLAHKKCEDVIFE